MGGTVKGTNYSFEEGKITFFDVVGWHSGRYWAINYIEQDKEDAEALVMNCIQQDVASGNVKDLAIVLVSPYFGVCLFLQGIITPNHLAKANETPSFIDIPEVKFGGRKLTVRVKRDASVATADRHGKVL